MRSTKSSFVGGLAGSAGARRRPATARPRGIVAVVCLLLLAGALVVVLALASDVGLGVRMATNREDVARARCLAAAGVEQAFYIAATISAWRSLVAATGQDEPLMGNTAFAGGTFSAFIYDPDDPLGISDPLRPVEILGLGRYGTVERLLRMRAAPPVHETVTYAVCATLGNWDLSLSEAVSIMGAIRGNEDVRVTDGSAVSVAGDIYVPATAFVSPSLLDGDTQRIDLARATAQPTPDFGWFTSRASRVNSVLLSAVVLSPTSNPYGWANADGLYYIDAAGLPVVIENVYLRGTLVIQNSPSVRFRKAFVHKAVRSDFPAILCNASGEGVIFELDRPLDEAEYQKDYNEDGDQLDILPCEINGIVFNGGSITGFVAPGSTVAVTVRGAVVALSVSLRGSNVTIQQDLELLTRRVYGFVGQGLRREPGSAVWH